MTLRHLPFALLFFGIIVPTIVLAQARVWHSSGQLPSTGICGYFWNEQTGVAATVDQFFYTRDGLTWQQGSAALATNSSIYTIRCFDGKTLYAAVSNRTANECWSSTDKGVTWNLVLSVSPKINKEVDVFWDYNSNSPQLASGSVARMDGLHLIRSADDSSHTLAYWSNDGGTSWNPPFSVPPPFWDGGWCAYADTVTKTFFIGSEDLRNSEILESTDYGQTWRVYPPTMPTVHWVDDIEGSGSRLYFQNINGLYTSYNGGNWDSIGGPQHIEATDDLKFCVYGCGGLTVTAFDDSGGVWTSQADNITPVVHSTFQTTIAECDSSTLQIKVDSFFVTGRITVGLSGDPSGAFQLLGPDTLKTTNGSLDLTVRFTPKDHLQHSDSITITPIDFPCASAIVRVLTGVGTLAPAIASAPSSAVGCAGGMTDLYLMDTSCETLVVTSATIATPGLFIAPFDSTVAGGDTIPVAILPGSYSGPQHYSIRIRGTYEPSNTPFDTTISLSVDYSHITSTLAATPRALQFSAPAPCATWDTILVLHNTGCDTLSVSLAQSLSNYWQANPSVGAITLLPGQMDTIYIHFASTTPGTYSANLLYSYTGPTSGTDTIELTAIVPKGGPALALSPDTISLGDRPFCTSDTQIIVTVKNLACDSTKLTSIHLANSTDFSLVNAGDTILSNGGTVVVPVLCSPSQHGASFDTLVIHHQNLDGSNAGDTTMVLFVNVVHGMAALAASTQSVDMGTLPICEERDTSILIEDTGCDSVCVSSIATSNLHFTLTPGQATSFCLAPHQRDTIYLRTQVDTSGGQQTNTGLLQITSDATPAFTPVVLSREIEYPVPWQLVLSPIDSCGPGGTVTYRIIQHGTLPSDVSSMAFDLVFDDDLLQLASIDESWVGPPGYYRSADGLAHYLLHVSPVPADSVIATLHLIAYEARALSTQLSLDSVQFTSTQNRPADCIASTTVAASAFQLRTACNGPLLRQALSGTLAIDGVIPNPTAGMVTVMYRNQTDNLLGANIEVSDALGRTVLERTLSLLPGPDHSIALDLTAVPAGVYRVRVNASNWSQSLDIVRQ